MLLPKEYQANHMHGMQMFYRYTSDSTYEFTFIHYQNCGTDFPPSSIVINAKSKSITAFSNFTCSRLAITGTAVPPLEPPNMFNCTEATTLCYEEYVYRGNWTSTKRARDWKFSAQLCCRPGGAFAPANLLAGYQYVECGLNNLDFPDYKAKNWSPIWHNRRPNHPGYKTDTIINYFLKTLCYGNYYSLDQSAREYQGDSLSYGFYRPQGNSGVAIGNRNGYSFSSPLPTLSGPLKINPSTGIISIVPGYPTGTGIYVIGIEVEEWRNDTVSSGTTFMVVPKRMGHNRRELTIMIDDSSTCRVDNPHIKGYHLYSKPEKNTLKVYFHNGKSRNPNTLLRCNTLSSDGSEFRVVDSSNYVAPFDSTVNTIGILSASWKCVSGHTEVVSLELDQKISCIDYYIILKKGTDLDVIQSECGFWEPEFASGTITTESIDQVNIGPDTMVCSNKGFSMKIKPDSIYSKYSWNTWDTTREITVNYARKYWLRVENDFGCFSIDTMEIFKEFCKDTTRKDTTGNGSGNVGIESHQTLEFEVYPNPAKGRLFVKINKESQRFDLILRNQNGQILVQTTVHDLIQEIDVRDLSAGMYFLEILGRDGQKDLKKIIIQ